MTTEAIPLAAPAAQPEAPVSLEEYYEQAGPDYAAWSPAFNMHFGFFRWGMSPFRREQMLEQMNAEVLERLRIADKPHPKLIDLGCGLGATLRSMARRLPDAKLIGLTKVPWQVTRATELNRAAEQEDRIRILQGDYEDTVLPRASYDAAWALESSCHASGTDKAAFLREAHRILKPGARLVLADGFLLRPHFATRLQRRIFERLCECWVIDELGELNRVTAALEDIGFTDIHVEHLQFRLAPSVAHVPWVTLKFLCSTVLFGGGKMTRARWNNVLAPILLPLVSAPFGPMSYCIVTATKAKS